MAIIKTPDQKVRVFISSTINELADERKAAREAINNLRLTPVFFEAGARPHPPRDLYSAYLDQSHIFLGIYWNSYGWVAPGAEISGLEDEYRLCSNKPKLIYIKRSDERQSRLNDLLGDIEKSDTACYQMFDTADELGHLIENDLSVLMSEIFENALFEQQQEHLPPSDIEQVHHKIMELPFIRSEIYGRDEDQKKLLELLSKPGVRLITLLGAGGTGKTTLSIHIGHQVKDDFKNGIAFIPLAPLSDHRLVASTLAEIIGVQDSGKQPIEQTLIDFLSDKSLLLVIDNFEQVIEASNFISDIITRCPNVKLIITSRTSLHIRNERIFNLAPLALPDEHTNLAPDELMNYPATQLFVERALEVNPRMAFSKENTEAIIEICQRMDGLPLAIELAAARTKFFQPAALMSRIEKTLDFVSKGHKDLPERQQTLRATIEWSYNLLTEDTQQVFKQLGIFRGSWTMEAADTIINSGGNLIDIEEMTERLMDVSLIKPVLVSHSAEPRFNMLQTVHEYAYEMLLKSTEADETLNKYADYFLLLLEEAYGQLYGMNSEPWLDKIELEFQNIRASFYRFVTTERFEIAWKFIYLLSPFWSIRGGYSEASSWIDIAGLELDDHPHSSVTDMDKSIKGKALTWAAFIRMYLLQIEQGFKLVNRAEDILRQTDDQLSLGIALTMDGSYGAYMGFPDSAAKVSEAEKIVEESNNDELKCMFYTWSLEYFRMTEQLEKVKKNLNSAREIINRTENKYMMGILVIVNFHINLELGFYDEIIEDGINTYKRLPEKGYKGAKSACNGCVAAAYLMKGMYREAENYLFKAIHYARESGEKESEFWGVMSASLYYGLKSDIETSCKLFGSANAFIEATQYPIVGSSALQYDKIKEVVIPDENNQERTIWYDQGKKMMIEDAIVYALKRD